MKTYNKTYCQRPEVKELHRIRNLAHSQRPEVKKRAKIRQQTPGVKAWQKTYYQRPEVKARGQDAFLRKLYGITLEARNIMIAGQGSVCAVCRNSDWGSKGPTVDHNHITGAIRGILCMNCNRAIGLLRDNPKTLRAAADYLERT